MKIALVVDFLGYTVDQHLMVSPLWGSRENVIPLPIKRQTTSKSLLDSSLTHPRDCLEVRVVLEGKLADRVYVAAGNAQISPDAYIIKALRALHGGGAS